MEPPGSSGALVSVPELARVLATPGAPSVLDVRWRLGGPPGIGEFRAGHVPGAVFVDLDRDLSGEPGPGGRHPLPRAADFQAAMRRAGVSGSRPVVAYDAADAAAAARAWWLLRYFGHGQAKVLDGGYRAWVASGEPVETGNGAEIATGDFTARPGHLPVLTAGEAARLARRGVLLDARSAERYQGEVEPVDPVAGHIPGAVSAPATANLGPDGRFLPPAQLRARFAELGVTPRAAVGAYCGSGVTAAQEVLALTVAGTEAALYAGSWSEWITDPSRPVAAGPDPG
jgi:thiosulfate/3-mercaptopyruvate sulfurtransferase